MSPADAARRLPRSFSLAESAPALLPGTYRAQKINSPKGRPKYVCEVKFTVRALPQQEPGEPDLTTGADNQIGVRQVWRVEKATDRVGCDRINNVAEGPCLLKLLAQQRLYSIHNFLP